MNFEDELKEKSSLINEIVLSYLPSEGKYKSRVLEAGNYSVINGGKRLRPLLMQSAYLLIKGKDENGEYTLSDDDKKILSPFMAAIEMVHSFSLVHDDLPCIDNDRLRRGKPSTWAAYGEDMAVLAGDGLVVLAYETALKSAADPKLILKSLRIFTEKLGLNGMLAGQSLDVEMTGSPLSEDQMRFIYEKKTGALIQGSMMIGAVLAGAASDAVDIISDAAMSLGMAFQIQDDILDVISTDEELGKPVGSDIEQDKYTWVRFHGLEQSKEDVKSFTKTAVSKIGQLGDYQFLIDLMMYLIDRKY